MSVALDFTAPLFVPANRPERFAKAASSGADAIILDLEDAVPADAKGEARGLLRADFSDCPIMVRINAIGTAWHLDDVAAVSRLGFSGIMIPKAERPEDIAAIAEAVGPGRFVVPLIETARGMERSRALAGVPGVGRLAFGSIDYCADLGCAHTRTALLAARSELVLASRLAGLSPPADGVTTSIHDLALITDDARHAREVGFGSKLCIHPAQIDPVRRGFAPDEAEIAWAEKVAASGDGASAVDGNMVDEPVRQRARSILARAAALRKAP
ncbi:HpcH/HpaI aldolase/citrate lyase family protein [Ancylobacter polymorphus]|uniref:CoA ester lyase n=1 Tax=Ancylobacter polymorphus TaxID=223390 RepID=A0A9E7A5N8_9HYPH|nr:CoA ester lyase [Ancylobacter polymorphus]UOK73303.1 CoA ester lyase [Ancylobacter polymorphus]